MIHQMEIFKEVLFNTKACIIKYSENLYFYILYVKTLLGEKHFLRQGQHVNGQNVDGQNVNGQNVKEQNVNGKNVQGQNANRQHVDGQNVDD